MKIILFSTMMFVFISNTNAQNLHLNLFAGTSNYSGDLQDKGYTFSQSHFAGGFGVSYDITDHFSAAIFHNFWYNFRQMINMEEIKSVI